MLDGVVLNNSERRIDPFRRRSQSKPIIVDMDTVAPGVVERHSYPCAGSSAGGAFVQRILQ